MSDAINPDHYKFDGVETIQITEHLNFNGGNAVKYIVRATRTDGRIKGNRLEDLRKAEWYIKREIERRQFDNIEEELDVAVEIEKPNARVEDVTQFKTALQKHEEYLRQYRGYDR